LKPAGISGIENLKDKINELAMNEHYLILRSE
jgi:hypothetical protein